MSDNDFGTIEVHTVASEILDLLKCKEYVNKITNLDLKAAIEPLLDRTLALEVSVLCIDTEKVCTPIIIEHNKSQASSAAVKEGNVIEIKRP